MFVNDAVGLLKDLMKDRVVVDEKDKTEIKIQNGIIVTKMSSREFGGEYKRNGLLYMSVVWLATVWSLVRNLAEAIVRKIFSPRKPLLKILWEMGRNPKHFSCFFGDRLSKYNHKAKTEAASWRALDLFYNYQEKIEPNLEDDLSGRATRFWIGRLENRQAVRNRLKIAINLLSDSFRKFANEPEIRLLSVASGSAQAVIRAMQENPNLKIRVTLIDLDGDAIAEAKKEVEKAGLTSNFDFVVGSVKVIEDVCQNFKPHIVEMIGFLDYRTKKQAIRLIGRIRNVLPAGGIFLTCNIRNNREKFFLTWLLLWPMIYRSPQELGEVLTKGGFENKKVSLVYEPFKIHGIAVAVK